MEKVGRNDPCPCGSGKKFKKCCEDKVKHKVISATPLEPQAKVRAEKISSLFPRKNLESKGSV